jgi:hypothetical protein
MITRRDGTKSEAQLKQALGIARVMKQFELVAQLYIELGYRAFNNEHFQLAAVHFQQALDFGRATDNKRFIHLGLGNLGAVYGQMCQFSVGNLASDRQPALGDALAYLKQARAIAHDLGDVAEEIDYCTNICVLCLELRDWVQALAAFEAVQALNHAKGLPITARLDEYIYWLRRPRGNVLWG